MEAEQLLEGSIDTHCHGYPETTFDGVEASRLAGMACMKGIVFKSHMWPTVDYDVAVFTGHISPDESLTVAREAKNMGFEKLLITHPYGRSVGASAEHLMVRQRETPCCG
ncbi:MAG: hypothetical protein HN420_02045 [Rhodospirillaceae bacterium]|jgi:hypothetical protein|nr:hypothetical protein [Rhodospirillaceae bacterium]